MQKNKIEINAKRCKGCGVCVVTCPKKCIQMSQEIMTNGNAYAVFDPEANCMGCGFCFYSCPELGAIVVHKAGELVPSTNKHPVQETIPCTSTVNDSNELNSSVEKRLLMKGNEAIVHGALMGGGTHYFGYPITPASEIAHAAATWYPKCGRHFLQTECEVSSVSMLYGAASAGARVMTGTSGLGLSLMAEQLSYLSAANLPCIVVDVQRVGPGLGNIWPEQSDYNCTVKGGGHGSYHLLVVAPDSVQEMFDWAYRGFEIAEKWGMVLLILTDAYIGQMMEPISLPRKIKHNPRKDWALYGDKLSRKNVITSIEMSAEKSSQINQNLIDKYERLKVEAVEYQSIETDDAEIVFVAFGISARIAKSAIIELRKQGIKAGLLRPKTLFPYPEKPLTHIAQKGAKIVVLELNSGHMFSDVERIVYKAMAENQTFNSSCHLIHYMGGIVPTVEQLLTRMKQEELI